MKKGQWRRIILYIGVGVVRVVGVGGESGGWANSTKSRKSRVHCAPFEIFVKGELKPEISFLNMKVLTLIKVKSYVFL